MLNHLCLFLHLLKPLAFLCQSFSNLFLSFLQDFFSELQGVSSVWNICSDSALLECSSSSCLLTVVILFLLCAATSVCGHSPGGRWFLWWRISAWWWRWGWDCRRGKCSLCKSLCAQHRALCLKQNTFCLNTWTLVSHPGPSSNHSSMLYYSFGWKRIFETLFWAVIHCGVVFWEHSASPALQSLLESDVESTASSPRGAKRSRTRRSSDEEGGTLCEVKLEDTCCS